MSGVPDYTLEDTLDFKFTTRQFSTGAPFAFAGGVIEIYEDNSLTQITGAETLTLEFDGVTGLHNLRVAATTANGFENGKSYHCVVSAGTVDSVSVVGEVVQQFSIGRSAAAADLANGTDGLGAIKAETASILADTDDIQTRLPAALVSGKMDSDAVAISGSTTAADNLQRGAEALVLGAAVGTPTTTVIDTDLTETTVDHYNGRIITFTTGNITGQATDITAYDGAGELTVTVLTDAPAATDEFVIS